MRFSLFSSIILAVGTLTIAAPSQNRARNASLDQGSSESSPAYSRPTFYSAIAVPRPGENSSEAVPESSPVNGTLPTNSSTTASKSSPVYTRPTFITVPRPAEKAAENDTDPVQDAEETNATLAVLPIGLAGHPNRARCRTYRVSNAFTNYRKFVVSAAVPEDKARKTCALLRDHLRAFFWCTFQRDDSCGVEDGRLVWRTTPADRRCDPGCVESAWWQTTRNAYGNIECRRAY